MLRIDEDEFSEDIKEPAVDPTQHPKDTTAKSRFNTACFQQSNYLGNPVPYGTHNIKTSSPASSLGAESAPISQFGAHTSQGQSLMAPIADLNFYSIPEILSDQERIILSDAEKFMRSKEANICSNEYSHMHDEFAVRKYYHPLFAHGICRWPGCEMDLEDIASFVKHLNSEHGLDDRSTAQARVQMQVVSQLESHLQKERDRLQAMMHHLYLSKQLLTPKTERKDISEKQSNFCSSPMGMTNMGHSFHHQNSSGSINLPLVNSSNLCTVKKRNTEKSTFSVTGGLPYMLERAGLDVQQEIQRNREFYKNADVRPPFTYASLIRQAIIDSPDKQLTLNEIYNWFQNTFCYFRRNAATWKNATRTNLSVHKCFVRYEDDFGSFWMVDDNEFIKRRHLTRGRPRKYDPSSSQSQNSCQSGSVNPSDKNSCENCSQHCTNTESNTGDILENQKPNEAVDMESFDIFNSSSNKLMHDIYANECLSRSPNIGLDDSPTRIFANNINDFDP